MDVVAEEVAAVQLFAVILFIAGDLFAVKDGLHAVASWILKTI